MSVHRVGFAAVVLTTGLACAGPLSGEVTDPFEGARVEGTVVPFTVDYHNAAGADVLVELTIDDQAPIPLLTWPAQDHVDFDIGGDLGPRHLILNAFEVPGWEEDCRTPPQAASCREHEASNVINIEVVGSDWPSIDYPARPAS